MGRDTWKTMLFSDAVLVNPSIKLVKGKAYPVIRGRAGVTTDDFAYYLTKWSEFRQFAIGQMTGSSGRQRVPADSLSGFEVSIPPIPQQKRLTGVLSRLDDKIECNRRLNRSLEDIVRALFKSWFIDFDPVLDNAVLAGNPIPAEFAERAELRRIALDQNQPSAPAPLPEGEGRLLDNAILAGNPIPEELADRAVLRQQAAEEYATPLPDDLRALFPAAFIQTAEMGWIPDGWTPGDLSDIARNVRRTVQPTDVPPAMPYIGLQHMPRRCIALESWGRADDVSSGKSRFKEGEILFGKLRPYFHKVGIAPIDGVCSTDILVIVPKAPEWADYVLSLVSSKPFVDYTDARSAGTKMPRTNWKDMGKYPLALPPDPLIEAFQNRVAPNQERIRLAVKQNHRLAEQRDALLPKLLSGEVCLSTTETAMEGSE